MGIITSDKFYLKLYHKKPTQYKDMPDNIICGFCGKPKKFLGRYYFCPTCRNIKLPSGKPAGKISSKIYQKNN